MVTEIYVKGRFDFGVGKCAVVITEDVLPPNEKKVLHKVAWKVPETWDYKGNTIEADQFNCEILAVCYGLQWCKNNDKQLVNIYANTSTCEKWYARGEIPETRMMRQAYLDAVQDFNDYFDNKNAEICVERIFAEYIPKNTDNEKYAEYNLLVNDMAVNLR